MSASGSPRARTWPAIAFLVVLVELVLWNAHVIYRNQHTFEPNDTLRLRPASIDVVASRNPMPVVKATFATYHRLRRFAGRRLVISPNRVPHQFALERVSRLVIEVAPEPLVLPKSVVDRIMTTVDSEWEMEDGVPLGIVEDVAATRYALVWRDDNLAELLMPEAAYLRERAVLR